jgi:lysophospholipase L1-like esterase
MGGRKCSAGFPVRIRSHPALKDLETRNPVKKSLTGLFVLLFSLVLFFLLAEGTLRFLSGHFLHVFDVEMWKYARAVKVESHDPGVIEEHRPNADEVLMGVRVRTDAHGFRLPDPATEAKRKPNDRVVIALGDSVTFGWGAGEAETFPAQLEKLLAARCPLPGGRHTTVYNAGIGNCNTSMELARYKLHVRPLGLHPDWVILGYSYNDGEPDAVPSTNPFLWHSALLALASARFERRTGVLSDYKQYYQGLYEEGRPGWENTKRALRELGALLKADGVPATIILMPELHEPKNFGPFAGFFAKVAQVSKEAGFEVIDPAGDFPPGPGDRYWVSHEDAHPNGLGQAIYAQSLLRSRYACPTAGAGAPTQ